MFLPISLAVSNNGILFQDFDFFKKKPLIFKRKSLGHLRIWLNIFNFY